MYRSFAAFALLALGAVVVACQWPGAPGSESALDATWPDAPERAPLRSRAKFPPGEKVFMNHRGIIERIWDPDLHMALARRAYVRGRSTLAATEVERVRAGVLWFEERAAGDRRQRLEAAGRTLRLLERKLRRREIDTVRTLDVVFQSTLDSLEGRPPPAASRRAINP